MLFGHEQLDVYRLSVSFVGWAYQRSKALDGVDRHARDQLLRAAHSIPLNISEGNGRGTTPDRRRFFEIARGSALECAAVLDCMAACGVLTSEDIRLGKDLLVRIVSMLTKLGQHEHGVREEMATYGVSRERGTGGDDYDHDNDNDNDRKRAVTESRTGGVDGTPAPLREND